MDQTRIEPGVAHTLGTKAFLIFFFRYSMPALGILIVSAVLALLDPILSQTLVSIHSATVSQASEIGQAFGAFALGALGVFIIFFCFGFLVAWLKYSNYKYTLGDTALEIEQGILYKDAVSIPYRQIQNVDFKRPLAYRVFGLCKVIILTAGHEDSDVLEGEADGVIPMMDLKDATELRETLLGRTHVQEVRDSNY